MTHPSSEAVKRWIPMVFSPSLVANARSCAPSSRGCATVLRSRPTSNAKGSEPSSEGSEDPQLADPSNAICT